jgi:hypothetical protein
MQLCFKLPIASQSAKNACWLHAIATILCAGSNRSIKLRRETRLLSERIDQAFEAGFVRNNTEHQGISPANFKAVYEAQGFERIHRSKLEELMINPKQFSEGHLSDLLNEFGPLIFVRPARGQGFHAQPIMGAAINPDKQQSQGVELLAIETPTGKIEFIAPDELYAFSLDFETEQDRGTQNVMGLWYYSKFHNNTASISKLSDEKILMLAKKIPGQPYTASPLSSDPSEAATDDSATSSSDSTPRRPS